MTGPTTATETLRLHRSQEETIRAYRAFLEDVERSPWGRQARRLIECEPFRAFLHADGRIEPAPHSPEVQLALDMHAQYVREAARRHGFEAAVSLEPTGGR